MSEFDWWGEPPECPVCECLICDLQDLLWERHVRIALGIISEPLLEELPGPVAKPYDWVRSLRRRPRRDNRA